jgi:hypothetical protein
MSWSSTNSTGFGFQGNLCSTACTKRGHLICSPEVTFAYWTILAPTRIHPRRILLFPGSQPARSLQCVGDPGGELEAVSLESLGRVTQVIVCRGEGEIELLVYRKHEIRVGNS